MAEIFVFKHLRVIECCYGSLELNYDLDSDQEEKVRPVL
jgi:hypothetical protein